MGSVLNRGTRDAPQWYVKYNDSDGKRKQRHSHQPTKDTAREYLATIEARVARGLVGIVEPTPEEQARSRVTVRQLSAKFLDEYTSPKIKDIKVYRSQARSAFKVRIHPTLGDRAAASVTTAEVKRLRDAQLADGYTPGTVAQTLAALSKLYAWARAAGLVDCANPVAGCERTHSAESLDFLDRAEVGRLLAHLEERGRVGVASWQSLAQFPMVATAIYCGPRKGELFGLRWCDVALDAARLDVNRSYRGLPKSGKARHVPMHPELVRILRQWKERCPSTAEGLVFPVEVAVGVFRMGAKEDVLGLDDALTGAACHVPAKPWHSLRHTFAAHAVMSGASLYSVQRLLGHSSPAMTQRYAHLAPDFLAGEVARMSFAAPLPAGVASLDEARRDRASNA